MWGLRVPLVISDGVINPNMGTRQYPYAGNPAIPVSGYDRAMTPKQIGEHVSAGLIRSGLAQEALADELGIGQSTMSRITLGQFKRMPSELPRICARLGILLPELDGKARSAGESLGRRDALVRDFPLYASAEGGPGEVIRSTEPQDWLPRPASVQHVKTAYGMIVSGDSMFPEYRPGDTAVINPMLPLIGGEVYVFYNEIDGEARATIKELRRSSADKWFVRQHNPPNDFTLSRKEWRICHRVVSKQRPQ